MRKTLLSSVVAVSVLGIGITATLHAANDTSTTPKATPTTTNPLDLLTSLGLTNEQIGCLVANGANLDSEDIGQVMQLMTTCGIDLMDLMAVAESGGIQRGTPPSARLPPPPWRACPRRARPARCSITSASPRRCCRACSPACPTRPPATTTPP